MLLIFNRVYFIVNICKFDKNLAQLSATISKETFVSGWLFLLCSLQPYSGGLDEIYSKLLLQVTDGILGKSFLYARYIAEIGGDRNAKQSHSLLGVAVCSD